MVALGSKEGEPDASDLAEGQLPLPAVPGGEVAVEVLGEVHSGHGREKDGEVIDPFHAMDWLGFAVHTLILDPFLFPENPPIPKPNGRSQWPSLRRTTHSVSLMFRTSFIVARPSRQAEAT